MGADDRRPHARAGVDRAFYTEDALITTDIRPYHIYHNFPGDTLGGGANVFAVQARLALTDYLQLVAYKDGYIFFNDDVVDDDGFIDVAAALKWAFYQNYEDDFHLAVGLG